MVNNLIYLQMYMCDFILVPYNCFEGTPRGFFWCMESPSLTHVKKLVDKTREYERKGYIDPTKNMKNSKVFIFHGTNDSVIRPGKFEYSNKMYENLIIFIMS